LLFKKAEDFESMNMPKKTNKPTTRGTDETFLKLMTISGSSILKLLGVPPKQANKYQFRAVNLKEKRIEPDVEAIRPLNSEQGPVFIEFQAYREPFIRYRLMASVCLGCTQQKYEGNVIAGIIYTDVEYQNAALPLSTVVGSDEQEKYFSDWIKEIVLTKYTEQQLIQIDPKLIVLAPFTLATDVDNALVLEKGQKWSHSVQQVFSATQQREALNILGLFILNRFRQLKYEEVIAMLNFDLMDSVAGRQVYEMGHQKGLIETAQEDVLEVLEERFGIIPTKIMEQIDAIVQRKHLKQLHKQALRCKDIEHFREILSKATQKQSYDSMSIE
jgi:predicted transposase YdaD